MISPVNVNKDKILYIILTVVFVILLSVAVFLFVQIQGSNQPLFRVKRPVPTEAPQSTPTPINRNELSSITENFETVYPGNMKIKKEPVNGGNRYTLSGGTGLIIFTAGNQWFTDSPSKGAEDGKIDIAGIQGYIYGETDKFYNINFKNGDKYYTFECVFNKSEAAITDCSIFSSNLKFLK